MIAVCEGVPIFENYYNGSGPTHANNVHSASKSILGTLVGIAVDRGDLAGYDIEIANHLSAEFPKDPPSEAYPTDGRHSITVEHLLGMSSSLRWREDDEYDDAGKRLPSTDHEINRNSKKKRTNGRPSFVRAIMGLPQARPSDTIPNGSNEPYKPGDRFNYSTADTHLLSATFKKAVRGGLTVEEYAKTHLFEVLGITYWCWNKDPQDIPSGGCNLFLTARALARFGQLYAADGWWNQKQIVSTEWLHHARTPVADYKDYRYGGLWWYKDLEDLDGNLRKLHIAWGHGGQFVVHIPDADFVISTTQKTDWADNQDVGCPDPDTKDPVECLEIDILHFVKYYILPALKTRRP